MFIGGAFSASLGPSGTVTFSDGNSTPDLLVYGQATFTEPAINTQTLNLPSNLFALPIKIAKVYVAGNGRARDAGGLHELKDQKDQRDQRDQREGGRRLWRFTSLKSFSSFSSLFARRSLRSAGLTSSESTAHNGERCCHSPSSPWDRKTNHPASPSSPSTVWRIRNRVRRRGQPPTCFRGRGGPHGDSNGARRSERNPRRTRAR